LNRNNDLESNKSIYFEETDGENNITIFDDGQIEYGHNNKNSITTKIYYKYILSNGNYIHKAHVKVNGHNGETNEVFDTENFLKDFNNLKENSNRIEYEFLQNSNTTNESIKIIFYNNDNKNILTLETDLL